MAQYGVILDAGSSGTRLYIYKWKTPTGASKLLPLVKAHSLPKLKLEKSRKIHPGVSTFADKVDLVGSDHLAELVGVALEEIPKAKIPETPIFLMATAGVRFLPENKQRGLLNGICSWLQVNTQFSLPDCGTHIQVISGETEGLYGWIAANYLLGGFEHPHEEGDKPDHHHTYGFLDMGGASAQIAFAPNSTEAVKHAGDLKLVRLRNLDGTPAEYKVFTTTWLGFGANKARERYVDNLLEEYEDTLLEIPDPCMPHGLRTYLTGEPALGDAEGRVLVGIGKFEECLRKTYPLLKKDVPCADDPCLINGQHVPAIDFNVNHFVGVSEYWHTTHGIFGGKHKAFDLQTYQRNVMDFCSRDWSDIEDDLGKRKKSPERKADDARQACFKASWLINMLYDGINIPRVGLESGVGQINSTQEEGPFRPVNKVDDIELSWTLGKMVLYAAGQIPAQGNPLPVGFGTNNPSGAPEDFELAGSAPLLPISDKDDDGEFHKAPMSNASGFVAILLLLLLAAYLLCKPEGRIRLMNFIRRRKSGKGLSFKDKLFGRNTHLYERVLEEGDASEFELGGVDSDDNDQSDSSDGSRKGRSHGLFVSKPDRLGKLQPPSALDRQGLAVRTESRERLMTLGRRSRAGSPQRQKSSLMTPLEENE